MIVPCVFNLIRLNQERESRGPHFPPADRLAKENRAVAQVVTVPFTVVSIFVVLSAVTDFWKFKVYNLLTIPLLFSGLIYHGVVGGSDEFTRSLAGALFGLGIMIVPYVMGGMGAGDVKLMTAVGAWLGFSLTYQVFIASSIAAGLYAVVLICMSKKVCDTWVNFQILWHRVTVLGRHLG